LNKLVVELKNTTPLLVGWYTPRRADIRGLRTTEIKGIWRWWARAFIGGALYDEGLLNGVGTNDVLLRPSKKEVECIAKLVGIELGLGLAIARESQASRFTIYVEPLDSITPKDMRDRWRRISLLTIKKSVEGFDASHRFRLNVEWSRDFRYRLTALKILLIALQFTGVGKGSRRGLGSLDVVSISPSLEERDLRSLVREAYDECSELVRRHTKTYGARSSGNKAVELPPLPVVSKRTTSEVPVAEMKVFRDVHRGRFEDVHNFFVRTERCRVLYYSPICHDELRKEKAAWFLGLPRFQKERTQRETGYKAEVERRASPIMLAFHTDKNKFGSGAFVTCFLSGDWPKKIEWHGDHTEKPEKLNINAEAVVNAYKVFSNEFLRYLRGLNVGHQVDAIWP